jgi:alpha-glucosidase
MLTLYREALRLRRELPELGDGPLEWWDDAVPGASDVLAFRRGAGFACVVNTGDIAVPLPAGASVLLSSAPLENAPPAGDAVRRVALPGDSTAWLRIDDPMVIADAEASRAATDTTPTTEVSASRG